VIETYPYSEVALNYRRHSYLLTLLSDYQITQQHISTKIWLSSGHLTAKK